MAVTFSDLKAIRLPATALILATAIGAAVIQYSTEKRDVAAKQFREQTAALNEARGRYQRSGEERESILRYLPAFRQLISRASSARNSA